MEIENKLQSVTGLVASATLNTKTVDFENKIGDTTNLAIKTALITKVAKNLKYNVWHC